MNARPRARIVAQRYEADVDLASLLEHPDNARRGDDDAVADSIDVNGFYGVIVAQESTRRILAGHTRRRNLAATGAERGPVLWLDVDDARARKIVLADNRTAELAAWIPGKLADVLAALGADLEGTGFTDADLAIAIAQASDAAGGASRDFDGSKIGSVLVIHAPAELVKEFQALLGSDDADRLAGLLDLAREPGSPASHRADSDEHYTPRWIFEAAGLTFDLDVFAPADPARRNCPARRYFTAAEDGLAQPWEGGLVWMNPPYSNIVPWVERFAAHGRGIALLPVLKESRWLGTLMQCADAVALISVRFTGPDGSTRQVPFGFALAGCGTESAEAVGRVAAADRYLRGAYHVRPGAVLADATVEIDAAERAPVRA